MLTWWRSHWSHMLLRGWQHLGPRLCLLWSHHVRQFVNLNWLYLALVQASWHGRARLLVARHVWAGCEVLRVGRVNSRSGTSHQLVSRDHWHVDLLADVVVHYLWLRAHALIIVDRHHMLMPIVIDHVSLWWLDASDHDTRVIQFLLLLIWTKSTLKFLQLNLLHVLLVLRRLVAHSRISLHAVWALQVVDEVRVGALELFPLGTEVSRVRSTVLELLVQFVVNWRRVVHRRVARSSDQLEVFLRWITSPLRACIAADVLQLRLVPHIKGVPMHRVVRCRVVRELSRSIRRWHFRNNRLVRKHLHAVEW